MSKISISIVYAKPHEYYLRSYFITESTTIENAILQSNLLQKYPEINLKTQKVGIFGRIAKLTDILKDGDRIEIYRPLIADPKEVRRKRALAQQNKLKEQKQANELSQQKLDNIDKLAK